MKPLLALTLTAVLALAGCSDDEPVRQRPSTAPSTTPRADPAGIVDDPDARIVGVTVRRSHPSVRSIIWSLCRTPRCHRADQVVAVTDDGFATRHLQALPRQTLETPLDGVFLLTNRGSGQILQPDGSRTPVEWHAGPPGPLKHSEQAVGIHGFGKVHALETITGAGHLVPTPGEALGVSGNGAGVLRIDVRRPQHDRDQLLTSYDGGRTWDERSVFDPPPFHLAQPIESATSTAAVVTGGDGATELPVSAAHRWDGERWEEFSRGNDPMAYLGEGGGAVLPDGRLLLSLGGWSSSRRPAGLWASNGSDWSDLGPVPMGAPFDTLDLRHVSLPILDIVVAPGEVTVFAVHDSPTGASLWSSTDAGRTWTELTAR